MMKRILNILLALIVFCAQSCSTMRNSQKVEQAFLNLKVFQTLSKHEALAFTKRYDVVKFISDSELIYDGKTLNGYFVLTGTYSYETKDGVVKTVPVYMLRNEYRKQNK